MIASSLVSSPKVVQKFSSLALSALMCGSTCLVTLALATPTSAIAASHSIIAKPFNGKDLSGWKPKSDKGTSHWKVGSAKPDAAQPKNLSVSTSGSELINEVTAHGQGVDLYSEALYGDIILSLDVMVPKESNSGIYVMGEYEVQVFDSHGKDANPAPSDMGAIYGAQPPKHPRYLAPGEWNHYEIHFQAPKFDASGKKTTNAKFIKVILNGVTIHENVEMTKATPGGVDGKEKALGPIMFQGNHGAVSYKNIAVKPLK